MPEEPFHECFEARIVSYFGKTWPEGVWTDEREELWDQLLEMIEAPRKEPRHRTPKNQQLLLRVLVSEDKDLRYSALCCLVQIFGVTSVPLEDVKLLEALDVEESFYDFECALEFANILSAVFRTSDAFVAYLFGLVEEGDGADASGAWDTGALLLLLSCETASGLAYAALGGAMTYLGESLLAHIPRAAPHKLREEAGVLLHERFRAREAAQGARMMFSWYQALAQLEAREAVPDVLRHFRQNPSSDAAAGLVRLGVEEPFDALVDALCAHFEEYEHLDAMMVLAELGGARALEELTACVATSSDDMRRACNAVIALAHVETPDPMEELAALWEGEDEALAMAACYGFAKAAPRRGPEVLWSRVPEVSARARRYVLHTLALLEDPAVIPLLLAELPCELAVQGLLEFGERMLGALEGALRAPEVSSLAQEAMFQVLEQTPGARAERILLDVLGDASSHMLSLRALLGAIAVRSLASALPVLLERLEAQPPGVSRVMFLDTIGALGGDDAAPALRAWLSGCDALEERVSGIRALSRLDAEHVTAEDRAELLRLRHHEDPSIWRPVWLTLQELAAPDMREAMLRDLEDADDLRRMAAMDVLSEIQDPEDVAVLRAMMQGRDVFDDVGVFAAVALHRLDVHEGEPLLREALGMHEDPRMRLLIFETLAPLQSARVYANTDPELYERTRLVSRCLGRAFEREPVTWVRAAMVRAWGVEYGTFDHTYALRCLVWDPRVEVRLALAETLTRDWRHLPEGILTLLGFLEDPSGRVRRCALAGLRTIAEEGYMPRHVMHLARKHARASDVEVLGAVRS